MYPDRHKVVRAESLREATELLHDHGHGAHVLAGGQSLVPLMKQRLARPDVVIDIGHLDSAPIEIHDDHVEIDALTTHAQIGQHAGLTDRFDIIDDAVPQIADQQVRNMGTIGGALAEADPGNDWGPIVIATGGVITAVSPTERREIPIDDFFEGPFTTALDHGELIESISLPLPPDRTGGAYVKAKRRQGGYGIASAGVQVSLAEDDTCESIGYCCTDDASAYVDPEEIEAVVEGRRIDDGVLAECSEIIAGVVDPVSDTRGSVEFKRNLCRVMFERAIDTADQRAKGNTVEDPMNESGNNRGS